MRRPILATHEHWRRQAAGIRLSASFRRPYVSIQPWWRPGSALITIYAVKSKRLLLWPRFLLAGSAENIHHRVIPFVARVFKHRTRRRQERIFERPRLGVS